MSLHAPCEAVAVSRVTGDDRRVLFDLTGVFDDAWGGMQEHVLTLGGELRELGWAPILLAHTRYADVYEQRFKAERIRVLRVPALQARDVSWQPSLPYIRALYQTLVQERIALYHLHSALMGHELHGLMAARIARVPAVMTYHCTPWNESPQRRIAMIASHRIFHPRVIAVSSAVAEMAMNNYKVPQRDTAIILNGVRDLPSDETSSGDPGASRQEQCADEVVIGVAARLERVKGIDILLEALALLDPATPFRVIIAGEGPEQRALKEQAQRLHLDHKVAFVGFRPDVRQLMRQWDLVVLPSRSQEGLPLTAIEALAARRPLIASRVGGLPEIVRNGENGWLVPPEHPHALAQSLREAIQDRVQRLQRGSASRKIFLTELQASAMAKRTDTMYRDVLGI